MKFKEILAVSLFVVFAVVILYYSWDLLLAILGALALFALTIATCIGLYYIITAIQEEYRSNQERKNRQG